MKKNWTYLDIVIIAISVGLIGLILVDLDSIHGFWAIQQSTSVLITDYLSVGGLYGTLSNVGMVLLLNLLILKLLKQPLNGLTVAALFTIFGFAFFGKNVWNSLPIYAGVILYARLHQIGPEKYVGAMLFSSGLAPLVSYMMFGLEVPIIFNVLIAILGGIFAGILVLPVSQKAKLVHGGFNLYNIGFTLGLISLAYAALFRALDLDLSSSVGVSTTFERPLWILNIALMGLFFGLAFIIRFSFKDYGRLLKTTGLSADYMKLFSPGLAFFNMAVIGSMTLVIIALLGFPMNGPVMAGIYTVMGFGAYGKHPWNSLPVMAGAYLAVTVTAYNFESTGMVIAVLFVTALAPVAGKYGLVAGLAAGFIHVLITPFAYQLQGGFDLYNNGFAAGFAALAVISFIQPLMKRFKPQEESIESA